MNIDDFLDLRLQSHISIYKVIGIYWSSETTVDKFAKVGQTGHCEEVGLIGGGRAYIYILESSSRRFAPRLDSFWIVTLIGIAVAAAEAP